VVGTVPAAHMPREIKDAHNWVCAWLTNPLTAPNTIRSGTAPERETICRLIEPVARCASVRTNENQKNPFRLF
jgi:hypothetical protein